MDSLDKLTKVIVSVLKTPKSRGLTIALLTALGLILHRTAGKKNPLVENLNHVGCTEGQKVSVDGEFDIIIVGGGKPSETILSPIPTLNT
jgi:hypothetical protein